MMISSMRPVRFGAAAPNPVREDLVRDLTAMLPQALEKTKVAVHGSAYAQTRDVFAAHTVITALATLLAADK